MRGLSLREAGSLRRGHRPPTGDDNDEIVISCGWMDFTAGTLRHAGYTEQEIAELRVEAARLL